jgi:hypothetical protein
MWKQRLTCNLVVFREEDQLVQEVGRPTIICHNVGSLGISEEIAQEHRRGNSNTPSNTNCVEVLSAETLPPVLVG